MRRYIILLVLALSVSLHASAEKRPLVWIYTDMSDRNIPGSNKEGTVNDPDDISAMAAYLMLSNHFDTRGIVVTSTHRKEHKTSPDQAKWANEYFGNAYKKDLKGLNKNIGGYQESMPFMESFCKLSQTRFNPDTKYSSLAKYSTVDALYKEVKSNPKEIINVLCWGALTEPAIFVKHCIDSNQGELLGRVRFISHWSNSSLHQGTVENPEHVANCRDDAKACAYLKDVAKRGLIEFYEIGAIGQHGVVSGSPKGMEYFSQFKDSELGKIFVDGKFAHNSVDWSDGGTFVVLIGKWGVLLSDIAADGTNPTERERENEKRLKASSKELHNELLRISKAAAQ